LARGATGLALLIASVAVAVPWLVYGAGRLLQGDWAVRVSVGGPVVTVVLTYAATLSSFLRKKQVKDVATGLFRRKTGATVAAVPGGALQLALVVGTLAVLATGWLLLAAGVASVDTASGHRTVVITGLVVLALLLILGGLLDQTALSLHPFYRRRLAAAFATRRVERADNHLVAQGYDNRESTPLWSYGQRSQSAPRLPEVVFAAAANLTGEQRAPLNAASFTFSADWIGGPDIGYVRSEEVFNVTKPPIQRDLTVEAAVAVSGAAIASATGRASRWYTTLLAVTGTRLGTWLPNPAFVERWNDARNADDWALPGIPRLRRLTYLIREVFGSHRYTDRLLQITDGGHYENLGLVEALRRRCTEIYVIDASGDRPPTAGTLGEAITLAYAELGVRITLNDDSWEIVPGSGTPLEPSDEFSSLNKRLSARAVLTGSICYPPESDLPEGQRHGVLVVAKALLTPATDYNILSYAARNDVFPHDSTADQFFNDEKFTAYTGLGRQIGAEAYRSMSALRNENKQPALWQRVFFRPPGPRSHWWDRRRALRDRCK